VLATIKNMKKNIFGLILVALSSVNIVFTIIIFFIYTFGNMNNIYMIGGTIISLTLIYLIVKGNKYGYIGTILFYGIQVFGTTLIFQNYRYGLILKWTQSFELIITSFSFEINFTAIILFVTGIFGLNKLKKIKVANTT